MTDKRYIPMTSLDVAARMNLIFKVHGIEKVEEYFGNIHQQFKRHVPHVALLNCYAQEKSLEKAEATMQKLRDMGWARTPLPYNIMMNLYYSKGRWEKLDDIMNEMDEKGLYYDSYTVGIRLSAYAAAGDSAGIDRIVEMMESNPKITLTWNSYGVMVEGYLKVGQLDKALAMLKKLEGLIPSSKDKNSAYTYLLTNYAELGKQEEVYRIWDLFKRKEKKINNKGYMSMMGSLSKLDDIEGMKKIFEEWESRGLSYDFRVPNHLIEAYCRKGLLGNAEAILERGIAKGGVPSAATWCYMAGGYLLDDQEPKALEALNKAVSICPPNFNPSKDTLIKCVEYLEKHGNVENAEEFIKSLEDIQAFSPILREKLSCFIKEPTIAEAEQGGA